MRSFTTPNRWILGALAVAVLSTATDVVASDGGTITGRVILNGAAPAAIVTEVTVDPDVCGAAKYAEELVVGSDKGVRWAVVSLVGAPGGRLPAAEPPTLDQNGCAFAPHVVIVGAGEQMNVLNNDGVLHNVHSYSEANPTMNVAQPGFRKSMPVTFEASEAVHVRCDIHAWMSGWIYVTDTPYAMVTEADGSFVLSGVPAGNYELKVWHELLGEQTQQITVIDGGTVEAGFTLSLETGAGPTRP